VRGDQQRLAGQFDKHRCAGEQVDGCKAKTPAAVAVRRDGKLETGAITSVYQSATIKRMRLGFTYAAGGGGRTVVGAVEAGTPAAGVLRSGDEIVSIDGSKGDQQELIARVNDHDCAGDRRNGCRASTPAVVVVRRDGADRKLLIYPRYYDKSGYMVPGFTFGKPLNPSVGGAVTESTSTMWRISTGTVGAIARIFQPEQRKQLSSVVGSYEYTRQAIQVDWRLALTLLAVISLALAIINLFPFLPLDGGHIFWSLVEKVKGSPVPFRVMEQASAMGFVLVLLLFAIGLSNDIGRLTGEGFGPR
jgi:regulator of sigma E protease